MCIEVVMKMIPNDIAVSQQCEIRFRFVNAINKWCQANGGPGHWGIDLDQLREITGVRCYRFYDNLSGFDIEDPQAYMWFMLSWG